MRHRPFAAPSMMLMAGAAAVVLFLLSAFVLPPAAATSAPAPEVVLVRLSSPPAALAPLPRNEEDGQLDVELAETQAYHQQLLAEQQRFIEQLRQVAPSARVLSQWTLVLNGLAIELNGTDPAVLRTLPEVTGVSPSRVFKPAMNVSHSVIGSEALWQQVGGAQNAGKGIRVGIIDSGIDATHPFMVDPELSPPKGFPRCDLPENCLLTTGKVIVAREYPQSEAYDASDQNGHGTHVSGTVAGVHGTFSDRVPTSLSGVAPKAWLGNYNVFPGETAGADEFDIIDAVEDAVADRMNVLNMSLGGLALPDDFEPMVEAVNNAVAAGVIVAVAAGNSGPGAESIGSPGTAERVITAGATTNPHFEGISVFSPIGLFGAALGEFANYVPAVSAPYLSWVGGIQGEGCEPAAQDFSGRIALIRRGGCTFTTKIRNAQDAGAVGVLIFNNVAGDPVAMGHDDTEPKPTVPAAMISRDRGTALRQHGGGELNVDGAARAEFITPNVDILAGFSSRGPAPWSYRIKPDLTAPGVNVLSSVPGGDYAYFQGTSMATPHVAGAAAVLRQAMGKKVNPDDVKSALVTTAKRPVFNHRDGTSPANRVMDRGTGRMDLAAASAARIGIAPTNAGFGLQLQGQTVERQLTITNFKGKRALQLSVESTTGGPTPTVTPSAVTLTKGKSVEVTVTLNTGISLGEFEGDIVITDGDGTSYRVPYWVAVALY